jgi:selenide,water dikinase
MGARPLTALNIVAFPSGVLPLDYLTRILLGGADTARLASATIVGGHTIDDPEPKYGLAVTGIVKPGEELTNARATPGDVLVLTKPLGTGVIATAIKLGKASEAAISAATASMATLNRAGAEVACEHGVRALTDITGFGLLGHLSELCRASGVGVDLWFDRLPLLPEAGETARQGVVPGGTKRNLEYVEPWTAKAPVRRRADLGRPRPRGTSRQARCRAARPRGTAHACSGSHRTGPQSRGRHDEGPGGSGR